MMNFNVPSLLSDTCQRGSRILHDTLEKLIFTFSIFDYIRPSLGETSHWFFLYYMMRAAGFVVADDGEDLFQSEVMDDLIFRLKDKLGLYFGRKQILFLEFRRIYYTSNMLISKYTIY